MQMEESPKKTIDYLSGLGYFIWMEKLKTTYQLSELREALQDHREKRKLLGKTENVEEDPKRIELTKGYKAIVDSEDFDYLNQFKWKVSSIRNFNKNSIYAERTFFFSRKGKTINHNMHRIIINVPSDMCIDHINGNGLDNRKCNLRICTRAQNQYNRRKFKIGTSRFKGVNFNNGKWRTFIFKDRKQFYLGSFDCEIESAKCYDKKAKELYGEFANLNFPEL